MTTYRRKPEYVSAVQLTQQAINAHVLDKTPLPDGCYVSSYDAHPPTRAVSRAVVRLQTEKRDLVMPGDWIIRSADGALRVVKPDVFAAMYEAVPAEPAPRVPDDHDAHGGKYLEPFDRGTEVVVRSTSGTRSIFEGNGLVGAIWPEHAAHWPDRRRGLAVNETKHGPIRWAYYYACRYLAANGPATADMVGAVVWKDKKHGKTTSSGGGGDYAAQMLLGRMKKAGLVRHALSEGSTRWEVTPLGRAEAVK